MGAQSLPAAERDAYARDGYLLRRGLFSAAEIGAVAAETEALLQRADLMTPDNLRIRYQYHYETGAPLFELFDPVTDLGPRCKALMLDGRLIDLVAALLGEPACDIKDKLIYKPAGAGGYPLHQDYIAWPSFPKSFTTAVVAIDGADAKSGAIEVFPGAHARGNLSEPDGNFHLLGDDCVAGVQPVLLDLRPGDVAIFGAFMPHRSAGNRSAASRRHLLFSYNARSEGGPQRAEHYQDFHHWLRGMYSAMGLGDMRFR